MVAETTSNCYSYNNEGMANAIPFLYICIKLFIMKIRNILFAALAAAAFASCAVKPDVTEITGVINDTTITDVRVTLSSVKLDTVVAVVDGKFSIDVPTDAQSYGIIMLMAGQNGGKYGTYYIPDGYAINVNVEDKMTVTSAGAGAQQNLLKYNEAMNALNEASTFDADVTALCIETVKANPDNAVALLSISDAMFSMKPEQLLEVLGYVQEPLKSTDFIVSRTKEANAQMNTREGVMFTDFTVEHVYGYDRSMDPQPLKKEVKFSDYVGKGTYVLVDFWSPWCGPCKREIPNIKSVYEQYKDKGFEVLSLAVWERKPQSHTIETAAELGMDWLHINNCGSVPTDIYGVAGIPHLMLIGPDGTILKRGFHGLEGIQAAVAEYIK